VRTVRLPFFRCSEWASTPKSREILRILPLPESLVNSPSGMGAHSGWERIGTPAYPSLLEEAVAFVDSDTELSQSYEAWVGNGGGADFAVAAQLGGDAAVRPLARPVRPSPAWMAESRSSGSTRGQDRRSGRAFAQVHARSSVIRFARTHQSKKTQSQSLPNYWFLRQTLSEKAKGRHTECLPKMSELRVPFRVYGLRHQYPIRDRRF
jgi:hypothetical protein